MCASLGSKLSVYKTIILFSVLIIMCNSYFYIVTFEMNDWIANFIFIGFALKKIQQTIFADVSFTIKVDYHSRIQETIIPELIVEKLMLILEVFKDFFIRYKVYFRSVFFRCFFFLSVFN